MTFNIEASEQCVDVASREIGSGNLEKAEKLLNKVSEKIYEKNFVIENFNEFLK